MSSIVGIVNFDGPPVSRRQILCMLESAAYRAPDGMITWAAPNIGLGFGLLKTTPEASLREQPATSRDRRYAMVWDGRLDNRDELLGLLEGSPGLTRSSDDVSIVLAAFEAWGRDCVERLVGDFAFAVWDSLQERLTLARDPVGVRPIHYYVGNGFIAFGTEIKQLLALDEISGTLNRETLALYLCGNVTRWGDRTFYEDVRRLPGGHFLEATSARVQSTRYWNPDPWDQVRYSDPRDYYAHFESLFKRAVGDRLRSSTPVAVALSGGLDSSAITGAASAFSNGASGVRLSAYHRTHSGSPGDDKMAVEAVAAQAGVPVQYVNVDDLWAMKAGERSFPPDEPFVFHFESMHRRELRFAAAGGHRVILTGEGGDEAWNPGYMLYLGDWLLGGRFTTLLNDLVKADPAYRRLAGRYLRRFLAGRVLRRKGVRARMPRWIQPAAVERYRLVSLLEEQQGWTYRDSNYVQHRGFPPFFNAMDRETAEHSMEARHPFWDSRLVDFVFRLPPSVRYQGTLGKSFAKQALRAFVPPVVLQRKPAGSFGSLFDQGVRVKEAKRLEQLLREPRLADLGIVDAQQLRDDFAAYLGGDAKKWSGLYWALQAEDWLASWDRPGADAISGADPASFRGAVPAGGLQLA